MRVRFIIVAARLLGTAAVADLVKALEGDEGELYDAQGTSPDVAAIAADEREHAVIWDRLKTGDQFTEVTGAGRDGVAIAQGASSAAEIGSRESWHRAGGRSGTLRAVIFGVSDGLVSNLSLVMGVAGAASGNPSFILLAGVAGLLAGAFSMAAGEYISMQSQRELFERQIALERRRSWPRPIGPRASHPTRRRGSPTASSATRPWPSTRSSGKSSGSIPTSSVRRGGRPPARSSPSPSALSSRSSRTCSVGGRPLSWSASGSASWPCSRSAPA
jgi:hypothetical protein